MSFLIDLPNTNVGINNTGSQGGNLHYTVMVMINGLYYCAGWGEDFKTNLSYNIRKIEIGRFGF